MTAAALQAVEDALLRRVAAAARVFCFVDYDGTLAPLALTPETATPLPGTEELLHALTSLPNIDVAIVTGRSIADIRGFIDLSGIYYVGVHGNEVQLPNGEVKSSDAAASVRATLPDIKEQLEQWLAKLAGIVIEDKVLALACHYRLALRADAAVARQVVTAAARRYQQRGVPIEVAHGHEVIEIRPAGVTKGTAVCELLRAHAPSALAIYAGDDQTDEDVFAVLPPDAISIRIAPATVTTAAHYRTDTPRDVQRFLRAIVTCRSGAPAADGR